jgi:hypothetical protein
VGLRHSCRILWFEITPAAKAGRAFPVEGPLT